MATPELTELIRALRNARDRIDELVPLLEQMDGSEGIEIRLEAAQALVGFMRSLRGLQAVTLPPRAGMN